MKTLPSIVSALIIISLVVFPRSILHSQTSWPATDIWITGYYAGWMQGWENYGRLPAEEIDYTALTHIIHFGLVPRSDGTIDSLANSMTGVNSRELLSRAHAAGVKVLICIGGWGSDGAFRGATSPLNLDRFIDNLVDFMQRRGYDGIDVDWEYLHTTDVVQYGLLIKRLRARLDAIAPRPLLTAAAAWQPEILAPLSGDFDQINIMTYDLSGAWPGWVAWHNSPIYDGGFVFPSTLRPVPSADGMVENFSLAGIPVSKLGIGIDFYGYVWNGGNGTPTGGVTEPRQTWLSAPFVRPNVPFFRIWEDYYDKEFYRWDSLAHAPYLSIDKAGSSDDKFVSFCDESSCDVKINYAREKGLGGVFIWELGGGYLSEEYPQRDRLLQAVKHAAQGTARLPSAPLLLQPADGAQNVSMNPVIAWEALSAPLSYWIQISADSLFRSPVVDDSTLTESSFRARLEQSATYFWRVAAANSAGWSSFSPAWSFSTSGITESPKQVVPAAFALHQNFPNPFNGETRIQFDLPEPADVIVEIWSLEGKHVATLANRHFIAGSHRITWDPHRAPSGIYFCRLRLSTKEPRPWMFPSPRIIEQSIRLIYTK